MPASALGWPSPPTRGPILQPYGTKRKSDMQDEMVDWQQESQVCAKRMCTFDVGANGQILNQPMQQQQQQQQLPVQQTMPIFNNNNNNGSINCNNNNVQMPSQNLLPSAMEMITEEVEEVIQPCVEVGGHLPWQPPFQQQQPAQHIQTTAIVHNAHNTQSPQMLMDLNGETYSCPTSCDMDAACAVMDSDYTPDPQQYQVCNKSGSADSDSQFCRDFCRAGDESPTSGRVRCYCKPSWEGMMELRPYISDVY